MQKPILNGTNCRFFLWRIPNSKPKNYREINSKSLGEWSSGSSTFVSHTCTHLKCMRNKKKWALSTYMWCTVILWGNIAILCGKKKYFFLLLPYVYVDNKHNRIYSIKIYAQNCTYTKKKKKMTMKIHTWASILL